MKSRASITYRKDIDGLRSIAVTSVVLYHAGIAFASGGYVGVDIFYVISGYLITGIITTELKEGQFSILSFYDRRIRRIFPALFVMSFFTSVFAWFLLMPVDFKEYGESLTAMSLFGSNVYFFIKSGYFDQGAELRPLLHTWSLAVEEQYYVIFPMLMIMLFRVRKSIISAVCASLWAASLIANLWEIHVDPTADFYLPWFRAWELFTGSLLAFRIVPSSENKMACESVSVLGLAMIVFPIFLYTPRTLFPGVAAIPPDIGTALLVYASERVETVISRVLSSAPCVFIGLISYSFYLWHWPIFVFTRYAQGSDLTQFEGATLAAVAMFMGYLSWRFIEPLRKTSTGGRKPVFVAATFCLIVGVGFGVSGRIGNGLPMRLPAEIAKIGMVGLDINPNRNSCDNRAPKRLDADEVCHLGARGAPVTFAVIGDSFGDAFVPGVAAMAQERGQAGLVITKGGCVPLFETSQDAGSCQAFMDATVRLLKRHPEVNTVILVGRWTTVSEGTRFGADKVMDMFISDDETSNMGYEENRRVLERGLKRTLKELSDRRVFITAFIPEQAVNVPRTMALRRYFGLNSDVSVARSTFDQRQKFMVELLSKLRAQYQFSVIDVGSKLCDATRCRSAENGVPIYVDDNHLSHHEAVALRELFAPAFR